MNLSQLSEIAQAFTFVWLLGWALWALRRVLRRDQNTLLFATLLLFLLYGVPAGLDFVLGVPDYLRHPGYHRASHDPLTLIVASAYICMVPLCWFLFCRKRVKPLEQTGSPRPRARLGELVVLHLVAVSPLLALLFAPDPWVYRTYGVGALGLLSPSQLSYHHLIAILCSLGILALAGLLYHQRRLLSLQSLYLVLLALPTLWLHGKRGIVAFAAFLLGYQLWQRGKLRRRHFLPALALAAVVLTGYTQIYQRFVREIDGSRYSTTSEFLEITRLDFCRDHVLRLVVHGELRNSRILEQRGGSFLYTVAMFVPRRMWPEKPFPYAGYVVSAAYGRPPQYWGLGHPSSFLDEAIANLGWLGALLGPLLIAALATLGNRSQTQRLRALTALVVMFILHVQLVAFIGVVAAWAALLVLDKRRRKRNEAGRSKKVARAS